MPKTEKQKMLAGELYLASDPELQADNRRMSSWMDHYNASHCHTHQERKNLLESALGEIGNRVVIRPPFYCDYGYNIDLGDDVFINFNCVILDVCAVRIGDRTQIASNVQILTADHPREPELRNQMLEFGRPVVIGANVWIGAGAILLPGVSVGDNAIVGAGSVVTKHVPAGVTVAGNPARALSSHAVATDNKNPGAWPGSSV